MKRKRFRTLLLRGLLGGALGGLVVATAVVLLMQPSGWDNWVGWFVVFFVTIGLPLGSTTGALVGIVVWLVPAAWVTDLDPLSRALIGTLVGMICWAIIWWLNFKVGYVDYSGYSPLLGLVLLGAATGGIPGLLLGSRLAPGGPTSRRL